MAHYAIVCPEDAGHLLSLGPIGTELIRRGHRVSLLARKKAAAIAEQLNLTLHEWDLEDIPLRTPYLMWLAFSLFGAGWQIGLRSTFRWRAECVLRKAPQAIRDLAIEGLIVDQTMSAAGSVAEHVGIPFVTICSALLWNEETSLPPAYTNWPYAEGLRARLRNRLGYAGWHWYIGTELRTINRYRRAWKLRPYARIDEAFSPLAQIAQLCEELDFPRRKPPEMLHYIGSLATNRRVADDGQFPWDKLDGRPLIFASLGTVSEAINAPVLRKILAACAPLDAQLVLALGKWSEENDSMRDKLGEIPANALVVDFAPQLALLDRAALLITHSGANTTLEALSRAVPIVALPRSADQPGIASRVAHSGAGLQGSFRHSSAEEVRGLVKRVLAEDSFRQRAKQLQQALIVAGGATRAADITEEALSTRRPVRRH